MFLSHHLIRSLLVTPHVHICFYRRQFIPISESTDCKDILWVKRKESNENGVIKELPEYLSSHSNVKTKDSDKGRRASVGLNCWHFVSEKIQ